MSDQNKREASMRVSLMHFISWGIVPPTPIATSAGVSQVDDYIAQLRKARDDGFNMVWTPQLGASRIC